MMFGYSNLARSLSVCLIATIYTALGDDMCRERYMLLPRPIYTARGCASCYTYLFNSYQNAFISGGTYGAGLARRPEGNATIASEDFIYPDLDKPEAVDLICATLSTSDCERWISCCEAVVSCCDAQLAAPPDVNNTKQCPATWDGFSCWAESPPGDELKECPSFLVLSATSRMAVKHCDENGTWYKKDGHEWTDYRNCLSMSDLLDGSYIRLAFNIISIIFVVPAIIIFTVFRELRKEKRVKIHVQLLTALGLCAVVNCLWLGLVHLDLLLAENHQDMVITNNPVWCRVLSLLKLYLTGASYWWLLCEGIYLHTLLANAYRNPTSLVLLHIVGWGMPLLFSLIYAVVRGVMFNESCWSKNAGNLEWLIYGPNLVCLLVNMIFLVNILRILLFQLHSHPHEPSNFRRGVKAALMLIPLFGLHLLLTIYRPSPDLSTASKVYEYIGYIVNNSQGIFVAVIFCFCNKEVIANVRRKCKCLPAPRPPNYDASVATTQYTVADPDHDEHSTRKELHANLKNSNQPAIEMIAMDGVNGNINAQGKIAGGKDDRGQYHMVPVVAEGNDKTSPAVHL